MFARFFSGILLGFFTLVAASAVAPALAQSGHIWLAQAGRGWQEPEGVQPLDRLLPGIRRGHPGNFYDAEGPTYGPGGDPHYHLKWMTPDGRVIWYDTDARSGRVLRSSPGRDSFDGPRNYGAERGNSDRYPSYSRPYTERGPGYGRRGFEPDPGYAGSRRGWHGGRGGGWRRHH